MRLTDKIAIVTGSSLGIGAAIAKRYAAEGATVAVNFLKSPDKADEVVKEIQDAGGTAKSYQADVSKVPEIESFAQNVIDDFGRIDIPLRPHERPLGSCLQIVWIAEGHLPVWTDNPYLPDAFQADCGDAAPRFERAIGIDNRRPRHSILT